METRYRHIFPNHLPRDSSMAARELAGRAAHNKGKKKRASVRVACNACRSRKTACDGKRAQCTPCTRRGTECVYITEDAKETPSMALKRENADMRKETNGYRELFRYLQTAPEPDAHAALSQLRSAPLDDISGVLKSIRENSGQMDVKNGSSPDEAELEEMAYPELSPVTTLTTESDNMWSPSHQQQMSQPEWNVVHGSQQNTNEMMSESTMHNNDLKTGSSTLFGEAVAMNGFASPFF
ncbi:hypothetical protein EJ05DRAFT_278687 [Pseudovirgaria hyperparasitica]|uniref:Zn(2)-C6 fungal-type domain-containing protein n=1 Tax=Pseudovirgaria hyperparasitica TaxID=470096 RepID=A0A6A6WBT5_9PEZI|nr:uncharacterized protein EJ05DRAFT_278687 [Pseudovirgaria hyperparasitica]KAF2760292.1 hypothetical protein EJ05DRAFT_278687 [Pseudovirgaria hyperparasitica]